MDDAWIIHGFSWIPLGMDIPGAGLEIGMLRGRGIPSNRKCFKFLGVMVSWFQSFLVSWFLGFIIGFLVSWPLGLKVSKFQSFKVPISKDPQII